MDPAQRMTAVMDALDSAGSMVVHRVLADGRTVVVEHSGTNQTPDGRAYDNNYCWVVDLDEAGQIVEVHEYMDTQLVTETFGADQV